jgi:predicted ferric reductase
MDNSKKNVLVWLSATLLIAVAIILWFFTNDPYIKRFDLNSLSKSIANILGLIGIILFSFDITLSTLFKGYAKFAYLYKPHHLTGKMVAISIILHPLFQSVRFFNSSLKNGLNFLFFNFQIPLILGKIALFGLIILMLFTLYIKTRPDVWRFIHKWFILIFILAIAHITFIDSDLSDNIYLKVYMLSISCFSLSLIFYKNIIKKYLSKNSGKNNPNG